MQAWLLYYNRGDGGDYVRQVCRAPMARNRRRQGDQFSHRARRQPRGADAAHSNPDAVPQPPALGDFFRRNRARVGTPRAITDTAHKMARIIYHLVTRHELYNDRILLGQQHQDRTRHERRLRNQTRALGFNMVPESA